MKYPTERYPKDVDGFPVYAANKWLAVLVDEDSQIGAIPADDMLCALAHGCRQQLKTPYVSVGRSRTDLALPHPKGVKKPGFGDTLWAIWRFENPPAARRLIIAADTNTLDGKGIIVELKPPRPTSGPNGKREKNKRFRTSKGVNDGRGVRQGNGEDKLTMMGVRNLSGQRRRPAAKAT